jgi:STE24 endopeptidase
MSFDPAAATATYIDGLGAEALATAAAYTSGSHWLLLWGLVISAAAPWKHYPANSPRAAGLSAPG